MSLQTIDSRFVFLDKAQAEQVLPLLFEILHANMNPIAPTGHGYEEDLASWMTQVLPTVSDANRQIVLMYTNKELAGYLQYSVQVDTRSLMIEEIQIKKAFQGIGLWGEVFRWLLRQLPEDLHAVEAYAHKKNVHSQEILEHLGLVKAGENKNGISFHYKGNYPLLSEKYH